MLIDSHCHIFTTRIVQNVQAKPAMIEELKLNTGDAIERLHPGALQESADAHGLDACVLLPTASPDKVQSENDRFVEFTEEFPKLRTLGTLHPMMSDLVAEIRRIFDLGINGFKFSSFSQRFDPLSAEAEAMLSKVESLGRDRNVQPLLVLDTFVRADVHFAAKPEHLTTPAKLAEIAHRHQGINVICAHMGGLTADFDELRRDLIPLPNLYLDTANAAHTLEDDQFVELLKTHGWSHILFGTDWPWFTHAAERKKIGLLLAKAGFNKAEQDAVFGLNAARLFAL